MFIEIVIFTKDLNPCLATGLFLYLLENNRKPMLDSLFNKVAGLKVFQHRFFVVFRGYRKRSVVRNGLISSMDK